MQYFHSVTGALIAAVLGVAGCGGTTTNTGGQKLDDTSGGGGAPAAEASGGSGANDPARWPAGGAYTNENGGASTGGTTWIPPVEGSGGTTWVPPARGTGGTTWVPSVYPDGGSVPPTVDALGLPQGTCRSGALYYRSGELLTSSSIPVERQVPREVRPDWANTGNLDSLDGAGPWNPVCGDYDQGLKAGGAMRYPRSDGDLPIMSGGVTQQPVTACNDYVACHSGGAVGVTWDCGAVPQGTGGALTGGVYVLIGYVTYDQATYPKLGALIHQTLQLGDGRALLASDDDNNFGFVGTYTYAVSGNTVAFTPTCESQSSQYRAFPAAATFTETASSLELFDAVRNIRSTFVRISQ